MKIEGKVDPGYKGISEEMMTALNEYRIQDRDDMINTVKTQIGGIQFHPIIAKTGESWSGLNQQTTGQ